MLLKRKLKLASLLEMDNIHFMQASPQSHAMPKHPVAIKTNAITNDDKELLADLRAAARLTRTTPSGFIAATIAKKLGPKFAKHIAA